MYFQDLNKKADEDCQPDTVQKTPCMEPCPVRVHSALIGCILNEVKLESKYLREQCALYYSSDLKAICHI